MARSDRPRGVLITRFSALGDVAMTIPVVYPVCRANADVRFVLVTQPWPAGVFQNCPSNLTVLPIDVHEQYSGVAGMWRLASELKRDYPIDAVADLHSVIRSWAIDARMRLKGVTIARIDKGRSDKRALVAGKRKEAVMSTIDRYRAVFEQLGLSLGEAFTTLYDGQALPESPLVMGKQAGERWIAIAPFAAHEGKNYPLEQMTQVVDALSAIDGLHIFLMGGGKAEKQALRPIAMKHACVTSLAEVKHTFVDEFALLGNCELMVTMDSANAHLAALMGVPTITVWGATHPHCGFAAYQQQPSQWVQRDDLACRPCSVFGERKCRYGDYRCLTGIAPQVIVDKVKQALHLS